MLQIVHSLRAEGVSRIVVVTDDPAQVCQRRAPHRRRYHARLPPDVPVEHRDSSTACSASSARSRHHRHHLRLTCATEKRRRRKSAACWSRPAQWRVFINAAVCEGLRRLRRESNCLSVEPLETELGPQAPDQPEQLQPRLFLPGRFLPQLRDRRGRPAAASGRQDPCRSGLAVRAELPAASTAFPTAS